MLAPFERLITFGRVAVAPSPVYHTREPLPFDSSTDGGQGTGDAEAASGVRIHRHHRRGHPAGPRLPAPHGALAHRLAGVGLRAVPLALPEPA